MQPKDEYKSEKENRARGKPRRFHCRTTPPPRRARPAKSSPISEESSHWRFVGKTVEVASARFDKEKFDGEGTAALSASKRPVCGEGFERALAGVSHTQRPPSGELGD